MQIALATRQVWRTAQRELQAAQMAEEEAQEAWQEALGVAREDLAERQALEAAVEQT